MKESGDSDLVRRVLDGERQVFRELVRRHGLMLRSYLAGQLYRLDEVDDLAQEVFLTALKRLDTFQPGRDFANWLRGIARNKLHNHFRSVRRRSAAMEKFVEETHRLIDPEMEAAAALETQYSIEALLRCVEKLPEKLRKVVRGGLEGQRAKQQAEELNTTRGAIHNLHYRANQLLRTCVGDALAEHI